MLDVRDIEYTADMVRVRERCIFQVFSKTYGGRLEKDLVADRMTNFKMCKSDLVECHDNFCRVLYIDIWTLYMDFYMDF